MFNNCPFFYIYQIKLYSCFNVIKIQKLSFQYLDSKINMITLLALSSIHKPSKSPSYIANVISPLIPTLYLHWYRRNIPIDTDLKELVRDGRDEVISKNKFFYGGEESQVVVLGVREMMQRLNAIGREIQWHKQVSIIWFTLSSGLICKCNKVLISSLHFQAPLWPIGHRKKLSSIINIFYSSEKLCL